MTAEMEEPLEGVGSRLPRAPVGLERVWLAAWSVRFCRGVSTAGELQAGPGKKRASH